MMPRVKLLFGVLVLNAAVGGGLLIIGFASLHPDARGVRVSQAPESQDAETIHLLFPRPPGAGRGAERRWFHGKPPGVEPGTRYPGDPQFIHPWPGEGLLPDPSRESLTPVLQDYFHPIEGARGALPRPRP
jgi:hypothetical protein